MRHAMNIGEAAEAAGVTAKMIRHYEQLGLVPEPARTGAGYRQYGEREVSILRFIRHCRQLGFSMAQIADLINLWSDQGRPSRQVKALAQEHVADLERRMRELAQMKEAIERLVASCAGNDDPHCAILHGLAADSPALPEPGRAPARQRKATSRARSPKEPRGTASRRDPADLMAWTRFLYSPGAGR